MARSRHRTDGFAAIPSAQLEWVIGGRLIVSTGPSPAVLSGLKTLAETVAQTGQAMKQKEAEKAGMMQQVMQQVMGRRG